MYQIDLNCDLGESFGAYTIGMDEAIIPFISSANIACGYHAGDPMVMNQTLQLTKQYGVSAGAHPGLPDLIGFGRRNITVSPAEVKSYVQYQVAALMGICKANGQKLCHVKPHGALYNMAGKDPALAHAICEAIWELDENLILLALSGSEMITAAQVVGLRVAREVFADRAYEADGSLVPRNKEGAMIIEEEQAIQRVIRIIKKQRVTTIDGSDITMQADSVCVHGDGSKALAFVQKITAALKAEHIQLAPLHKIL